MATDDTTKEVQTETVKIQSPKGSRRPHVSVIVSSDLTDPVHGFVTFLRDHAVVGLAVGFIIGLQAQTLMKQLVDSFLTPLLNLFLGDVNKKQTTLSLADKTATFAWGKFVYSLVAFLFVVLAIYVIVKVLNLDKLENPKRKKNK
ncbi:MAG: MscL family protein [Candidatus Saccharimonadales bacterium]